MRCTLGHASPDVRPVHCAASDRPVPCTVSGQRRPPYRRQDLSVDTDRSPGTARSPRGRPTARAGRAPTPRCAPTSAASARCSGRPSPGRRAGPARPGRGGPRAGPQPTARPPPTGSPRSTSPPAPSWPGPSPPTSTWPTSPSRCTGPASCGAAAASDGGWLDQAAKLIAERGVPADEIAAAARRLAVRPVFTAHPTEAARRSILSKLRARRRRAGRRGRRRGALRRRRDRAAAPTAASPS